MTAVQDAPDGDLRPGRRGSDFAALSREIKQAGLLERRTEYYTVKIALQAAMLVGGWAVVVAGPDSWWQLLTAVFLGIMFTQCGFLAHDAGHKQIFSNRRGSYVLGLLHGNLAIGLSYGWWMDKHNRHHAHPNDLVRDPDVGVGALVFTAEQAEERRNVARWVTRHQAWLFFPMLALEGANLHVASLRTLGRRPTPSRYVEGALLAVHLVGYLALTFLFLPPLLAVAFILVQQGVFGLTLGIAFAPNHKGMPTFSAEDDIDYLRRQVLTSRNVRGGFIVDVVLGGLNYQIEHHLFPNMPRPHLKLAQPMVEQFCRDHGIAYQQDTFRDSYAQALGHLDAVGAPLRA